MKKWISVKDAFPERGMSVLVFCTGSIYAASYNGQRFYLDGVSGYDWSEVLDYETPTHWMPLPEPPK